MAATSQQSAATALPDQASVRASHPFTCNTCQVAFRSSDMQRAHMQTDWHRYNLKRRVASLPPLSSEIFTEKVFANQATAAATAAKASFEKPCLACDKIYYSQNAYTNHLNSQKHKANVAARSRLAPSTADDDTASVLSSAFSLGEPNARKRPSEIDESAKEEFSEMVDQLKHAKLEGSAPTPRRPSRPHHSSQADRPEHPLSRTVSKSATASEAGTEQEEKSPLLSCLFCNYKSPTFPLNTGHMTKHHGLFIPEQEYLVNPEGLITHLFAKINEEHQCLYCGKYVHTTSGIQTHMRDRGHCMINFDGEIDVLDVAQFYDFSSTWSDAEGDDDSTTSGSTEAGGVKLDRDTAASGDEEDEGWETDSTVSSVPTDEITAIPISDRSHRYKQLNSHRHHSHSDPRKHRNSDGFHSHAHPTPHAVYHDDYELHLPSGRTAGHRSLNKYYRQNLRSYPTPAERIQQRRIAAGMVHDDSDEEMADADDDVRGRGQNTDSERRDPHRRNNQLVTRANGGLGMVGVTDAKKNEIKAVEKRERKRELREKARYAAGNEKRGNFQKHYRDPLLQ